MFGLGFTEVVIILLALGILLFGGKKITELARSMGRASGEFKKGKKDIEQELKNGEESVTGSDTASETQPHQNQTKPSMGDTTQQK